VGLLATFEFPDVPPEKAKAAGKMVYFRLVNRSLKLTRKRTAILSA